MKLIQLHDKLVREINKKLGKMSVIKDIEKDTGLTSVSNDFYGAQIDYINMFVQIMYGINHMMQFLMISLVILLRLEKQLFLLFIYMKMRILQLIVLLVLEILQVI